MARDSQDSAGGRHRRRRRNRSTDELLAPLPGSLPPRAPWRRSKEDENWSPVPPRSTARPVGATQVLGPVLGGFVRPLPTTGTGTGDVLTLGAPPSLDPLRRLHAPASVDRDDLIDPLADVRRRSAAVVAGVVTGAVTLPPALGLHPAAAAIEPTPNPTPSVTLPARVEAFAPYIGQKSCDPHAKPGVAAFQDLVLSHWGHGGTYGIARACHVGGLSEHKEGRAWDFRLDPNDYSDQVAGQRIVDWLLANDAEMARRVGIMYMIWNEKIWSTYDRQGGWRPYRGPDNHTSHIHFSFTWAGAMKRTSWWTGKVAPIEYGPCQKYIGAKVPVYGKTINLTPCPKPIPKPKPKPEPTPDQQDRDDKPTKPTEPEPKPVPKPAYKVVVVRPGQTLGGIANRHDTSVRRIVRLNDLKNANRIFVGQKLRVPAKGVVTRRSNNRVEPKREATPSVRFHVVRRGETLYGIADRYDTSVSRIVRANGLRNADEIYPGQRLRIPRR